MADVIADATSSYLTMADVIADDISSLIGVNVHELNNLYDPNTVQQ